MRKNGICSWSIGIALVIGFALAGCGTVGMETAAAASATKPEEDGAKAAAETDFDTEAESVPNGDGVVITKYKGKGGAIVIPAAIGGKAVIGIGWGAFRDCASLTSITIPEGVTSIGYGAFYGCSSLTSLTIPDSVTTIRSNAFCFCASLNQADRNAIQRRFGRMVFE